LKKGWGTVANEDNNMYKKFKIFFAFLISLTLILSTGIIEARAGSFAIVSYTYTTKNKLVIRLRTYGDFNLESLTKTVDIGDDSFDLICDEDRVKSGWQYYKCVLSGIKKSVGLEVSMTIGNRTYDLGKPGLSYENKSKRSCSSVYDREVSTGKWIRIGEYCADGRPGFGDLIFFYNPDKGDRWMYDFNPSGTYECNAPFGIGYYYDDC
jgi:hypothetical protein